MGGTHLCLCLEEVATHSPVLRWATCIKLIAGSVVCIKTSSAVGGAQIGAGGACGRAREAQGVASARRSLWLQWAMCLTSPLLCLQLEAHKKEQAAREHEREKSEAERKRKGGASSGGNGVSAKGSGSNFRGTATSESGIQDAASDTSQGSSSARS